MKTIKIKELGLEIEKELHREMEIIKDIKIPKGWRLLTMSEFLEVWNNHRSKFDFNGDRFDEIIKQPLKDGIKDYPFYNVWLGGLGNRSELNGYLGDLSYDSGSRGVRFCRELKKQKETGK